MLSPTVSEVHPVMRAAALAAGAFAGLLGLIGFVVAIQFAWGGPRDEYVGLPFAWILAVLTVLAFGAGAVAYVRPAIGAGVMVVVAAAFVVAVSGSLGGWWSEAQTAFNTSALDTFASRAGSLLAIQGAVASLIVGSVFAFLSTGEVRATGTRRPLPQA